MAGRPQVTNQDAVGVSAGPSADIPKRLAIIAAAEAGSWTSTLRTGRAEVLAAHTAGPLVRSALHILAGTNLPVITQRCAASNPGEYDAIDVTGVFGTCEPAVDDSVEPRDEYEAYWRIVDGGTIGTVGITYYESTSNGRELSGLKKLGTATSFEFSTDGIRVDLAPPESEYVAFVADLRQEVIDHLAITSGGVHGAADSGPYTIDAAPSTNAEANTVLVQLMTVAGLHVVKTSSSIHGAADSTAATAITAALALIVVGSQQSYRAAALAFKAAFFGTGAANSGHAIRTTSSIHGAADSTNVITAATPSAGTLLAGDVIRVQTFAPYPSVDDLADAFAALADSGLTPGIVLLPGRTPASYAPTITAGLDLMDAQGKPVGCMVQMRRATGVETQTDLRNACETEIDAQPSDKRILWCATDALCTITEGTATRSVARTRFTGFANNLAVERLLVPFYETTWQVGRGGLNGVSLRDGGSVLIGHNEPANITTRLQLLYEVPNAPLGRPTVASIDYCFAGTEDREKTLRVNLIRDEIERNINAFSWGLVGLIEDVTLATPTTGTLDSTRVKDLQRNAAALLEANPGLAAGISDIDAPDLVVLSPNVTVDGDIIYLEFLVNWTPKGAIGRVDTTISTRTGGA